MASTVLSQQLRLILERRGEALPLSEFLVQVDQFCLECSRSQQPLFQLEEELQTVHKDLDPSSLYQVEVFVSALFHLSAVLSPTAIISTWWNLVLKPALRQPKLPTAAVNQCKELVNIALVKISNNCAEQVKWFRKRVLDIYLLDTFDEASEEDVVEWAELDKEDQELRKHWKSKLEEILLAFGIAQPADFLTNINVCFLNPSNRLQLLMLLNVYASHHSFPSCASVFANHPLMQTLVSSLLFDESPIACAYALTLMTELLHAFAIHAPETLKLMLPKLLTILARIICWKERASFSEMTDSPKDSPPVDDVVHVQPYPIRLDLQWTRLRDILDPATPPSPSPSAFFRILYYLYPCNTLLFLRNPITSLEKTECPYAVPWNTVLDEDLIRSRCEPILRAHLCHPRILWCDANTELSGPNYWASYNLAQIATECRMLEARATHPGDGRPALEEADSESDVTPILHDRQLSEAPTVVPSRHIQTGHQVARISIQDMVATSIVLRSNPDVLIEPVASDWTAALLSRTLSGSAVAAPITSPGTSHDVEPLPPRFVRALLGLRREILLLRNDFSFETWLSKEHVKHIERLYQSRVLSKNAELERQALFNKLRKYRLQVVELESELREHKEQTSSTKSKFAEYSNELHKKIQSLREEKANWTTQAADLRRKEREAQALFQSQKAWFGEAMQKIFELEQERKVMQQKTDRIEDFERHIEQLLKMQQLWDADFARFNESEEKMKMMTIEIKKLELRIETYEKTHAELQEQNVQSKRQIQSLELRLAALKKRKSADTSRGMSPNEIAAFAAEKARLSDANRLLQEKNADLRDEVEELRAMVEVLKREVSGKKGLVYDPRSSPLITSPSSPRGFT